MQKVLINSNKYDGQYIAIASIEDNSIIGSGKTPEKAMNEAKKKGIENPFLIYVSEKKLVHIYYYAC